MSTRQNLGLRLIEQRRRSLNDIQSLVATLGGDAVVPAIYDSRYNVTLASGVTAWDDARGPSGFGPQLVGHGTPLPTWDSTAGVTTDGSQNWLEVVPANAKFALSAGMWMAVVGSFNGAAMADYLGALDLTFGIGVYTGSGNIGNFLAGQAAFDSHTAKSATRRLVTVALSGVTPDLNCIGAVEVAGRQKTMLLGAHSTAAGNVLGVGRVPTGGAFVGYSATSQRAVVVGIGDYPSRAQIIALKAWATAQHTPTYDTSVTKAAWFDGDSLSFGTGSTTPATDNWPTVMMAQAGMAGYDWTNQGTPSRTLATINTVAPFMADTQGGLWRAKDLYFLWAGTNDVCGFSASSATVIARLQTRIAAAQAAGYKVVLLPPIPRNNTTVAGTPISSQQRTDLIAVKDWVMGGTTGADVVVPLSNNPHFNDYTITGSATNATWYNADQIHLTTAGYANIATDATYGVYPAIAGIR